MINLYIVGNENFNNNGDATIQPISAVIKKTINGSWQLEMEMPYDEDGKYKLLDHGAMLKVTDPSVAEISSTQIWRIYDYKRNTKSVSVIAFPRAMESTFDAPISQLIIDTDVTGVSAASSLNAVSEKYTVTSDITRTARSEWSNTNLNKAICGTGAEAFVNVWGGEVVYDNLNIKILDGIGNDEDPAQVMYGKNISEISYEVDDSGLTTRIYPLSTDGIRYWDATEEVEYIDSERISDYPIIHSNYMTTPYKLVEDDANSISRTAQKTADIKNRIRTKASTLSHSIWNTAVSNGWKIDYMASIYKDIIANIQAMVTNGITHANLVKVINSAITEGMEWMGDQEDPEWKWVEVTTDAWKYGSTESGRYAHNEWQYIDKKWRWFGDDYLWQEPRDDDSTWTWYENKNNHKMWYGTKDKYYLKGQYIYYTENGEFKKFWLDGDGWYDADKTDTSDYAWHQDSEVGGAWYFGTEDDDGYRDKYISGQWVFIEGTLYWFDDNGYYYGEKKDQPQYEWNQSGEAWWFGNIDPSYDSEWLASQWCKIDRQWYRFDSSGYIEDIYTECLTLFHNGMGGSGSDSLTTLVQTCRDECYDLLYDLMEEWSEEQFQNGVDQPTVTIKVDMIDLSKTSEYANYQNLETIKLGDTVKCVDYVHQIATTERVVELTYDLLRGYNTAITIGVASSSVGSMLSGSTGGGSSNVNNAINVDFIEQAIASKQAELNAGKNVTLTDNLDGTVTIDVDEPIRAGNHVTITKNSDGSYTVNADGGALDYWIEENQNFYRKVTVEVNNPYGWDCDSDYRWINDGTNIAYDVGSNSNMSGVTLFGYAYPTTETGTNQVCLGFAMINGTVWALAVSTTNATMIHHFLSGNVRVYSMTKNGVTLYYSTENTTYTNYSDLPYWENVIGGGTASGRHFPFISGTYTSSEDAIEALLEQSHFYTKEVIYTGISIGNNTAWGGRVSLIGNGTVSISDMDWFITKEGVFNGSDYKMGGVSINDIFQKILVAGNNIIIAEDGKTISAIDTTYTAGTNVQISSGNVISATDTNAVADMTDVEIDEQTLADGNVLKWNATSEKWENGTGGGGGGSEVEPNPSGTPTDTLNTIGIDGTIYDIAGGGGGGGKKTELFTNTTTTNPATITFNKPITDYDFITFQTRAGANAVATMTYNTADIVVGDTIGAGFYTGVFAWYYLTDSQTLTFRVSAGGGYISNITGTKLGGGGGVECQYDSDTETLYFVNGAQYDSDTETIVIL